MHFLFYNNKNKAKIICLDLKKSHPIFPNKREITNIYSVYFPLQVVRRGDLNLKVKLFLLCAEMLKT